MLVPNTAILSLLWELVPDSLGPEHKSRGCDVPSRQVCAATQHSTATTSRNCTGTVYPLQGHRGVQMVGYCLLTEKQLRSIKKTVTFKLLQALAFDQSSNQNLERLCPSVTKLSSSKASELFQGLTFSLRSSPSIKAASARSTQKLQRFEMPE